MKFSQLIEYDMKNIFLEIFSTNLVEKLFTDPFPKKNKIGHISGSIV